MLMFPEAREADENRKETDVLASTIRYPVL